MALIVIDPGHGGIDSGAVSGIYKEKNMNLAIGLKLRDYLLGNYQVNVVMTRTTDTTVSLSQRAQLANAKNADYYCSVHVNAGGGTGYESHIYNGPVNSFTSKAQGTIHQTVIQALKQKYSIVDRGQKRSDFQVLRDTKMPAILLENLFIDNDKDLLLLRNSVFLGDLATATGKGLATALKLPLKLLYKVIAGVFTDLKSAQERVKFLAAKGIQSFAASTTVSNRQVYSVQAGAYQNRANADDMLARLKQLGISDAMIVLE